MILNFIEKIFGHLLYVIAFGAVGAAIFIIGCFIYAHILNILS
jgi:hypothetical protein